MTQKTKKPEIRFTGFIADWDEQKFSIVAIMHARIGWQNLRKSEFLDRGDYYLITGTDFVDGEVDLSNCHYITKDRYDQDPNIQVSNGSILITKDGTLGKVAFVSGLDKPATLNAGVFNIIIRDNKKVYTKYLFQYLKAPFLMDYVNQKATGGTIKHLNQNILIDFPIELPEYDEQKKIGDFLTALDRLIKLQQSKVEKFLNVKKSMLEKMFPKDGSRVPEIRFAGFTGDWEEQKLGSIGDTYTGLSGKSKEDFGHGFAHFVTYMNVFTNPMADKAMVEPIEIDNAQNCVQYGDVFFTTSSETPEEVGMSCVWLENAENIYLNSFCFGYRPKIKINLHYLAYVLRSDVIRKKIVFLAQGISRYNISKNKVMDIEIPLPTVEEQEKIGDYFSDLDTLITLQQRKLEKLQNVKKAMLEKMFV